MLVEGQECPCLLDTGSQVTLVSKEYYESELSELPIESLDQLLELLGAHGIPIPYLGYVLINIELDVDGTIVGYTVPALVVHETPYNSLIPILIGTNVLNVAFESNISQFGKKIADWPVPPVWKGVYQSLALVDNKVVTTCTPQRIPANTKAVIQGVLRGVPVPCQTTVLTDGSEVCLPAGLVLSRSIAELEHGSTDHRVTVQLQNMSNKEVVIPANAPLCQVHRVASLQSHDQSSYDQADLEFLGKFNFESLPSDIPSEILDQLCGLLVKWKSVFAMSSLDLGHTDLVKQQINLTNETPLKQRHRRIPPAMFNEVKQHLADMLRSGVIRESSSPWNSPLVFARKANGSLRLCLDLREINKRTIKDAYYLPRINETLDSLSGSKFFSCIDLEAGFYQIEIEEQHKERTAFSVAPLGFYEYNRMPFGATNGPAIFQRLMERCMGDLQPDECLCYLDDLVIHARTAEENLQRLEHVFQKLHEAGLRLKPSKCHFLQTRVKFLGHVITGEGVEVDHDKTEALTTWPIPKNPKQLMRFLGFAGFYRRFVKDYSKLAEPLHRLLQGQEKKKKKCKSKKQAAKKTVPPWTWGEPQQQAFESLIEKLTSPPILAYADFDLPFLLHTDASGHGLGAVLYQHQEGKDRVIAYASRSLSKSERNYPAHKLEFLALKWAICEKFHDYLYGSKFAVKTDNNPLTYVLTTAKLDATGHRWLAALSAYDFTISYKPGKTNTDADALSRLPEPEEPEDSEVTLDIAAVQQLCAFARERQPDTLYCHAALLDSLCEDLLGNTSVPVKNVPQLQQDDPAISTMLKFLSGNRKPSAKKIKEQSRPVQLLMREWHKLHLIDGVLFRKRQLADSVKEQLVLPKQCQTSVLKSLHDDMAHLGRDRTLDLVRQRFFWPGMARDVQDYIASCGRCLRRKVSHADRAPLISIQSCRPLELVCVDYLKIQPSGGYGHVLVITDHFSKFAQAIPTRNETAKTTAKVLYENFIVRYGIPDRFHSDNGRSFECKLIIELCALMGIDKTHTTPYHAESNGIAERFNKTLLDMIGTLPPEKKTAWKDHISTVVHAYNCTRHETTGVSPYSLMFGREARLPVDVEYNIMKADEDSDTYTEYVRSLKKRMEHAYDLAAKHSRAAQRNQERNYNRKVRGSSIQVGDTVLVRNKAVHFMDKLADRWELDPYIVIEKPYPDLPLFIVKKKKGGRKRTLHRNMLYPINERDDTTPSPQETRTTVRRPAPEVAEEQTSEEESEEGLVVRVPHTGDTASAEHASPPSGTQGSHESEASEPQGSHEPEVSDSQSVTSDTPELEPEETDIAPGEPEQPTEEPEETEHTVDNTDPLDGDQTLVAPESDIVDLTEGDEDQTLLGPAIDLNGNGDEHSPPASGITDPTQDDSDEEEADTTVIVNTDLEPAHLDVGPGDIVPAQPEVDTEMIPENDDPHTPDLRRSTRARFKPAWFTSGDWIVNQLAAGTVKAQPK